MSGYVKTIVCLANSRKPGGRCVAGKVVTETGFGEWVRPVSARPGGELSHTDRQFSSGAEPALLDIIHIAMTKPSKHDYQRENHTIDETKYWGLAEKLTYADAQKALDKMPPDLWGVNFGSSYSGQNDRVPLDQISNFNHTLRLIKVTDLRIHVSAEGAAFGNAKRKVRGYFSYLLHHYAFSITDPIIEGKYLADKDGCYSIGNALLCVGISEPHQGYAYKLIAGVILPD